MAVLVFLGEGISSHPTQLPDALADYFGPPHAATYERRVRELLHEVMTSGEQGSEDFEVMIGSLHARYPALTADAVNALAQNYFFNWR
jgi:hypothetical protein